MLKKMVLAVLILIILLVSIGLIGSLWATNNRNSSESQTICNYAAMQNCKFFKDIKITNDIDNTSFSLGIYKGTEGNITQYKAFYTDISKTDNRKISYVGNYDYLDEQIPYRFLFIDINGAKYYTVLSEDTRSENNKVTVTLRGNKTDPEQDDMKYMRAVELKNGLGYRPLENTFTTVEEELIYYENSLDFTYKSRLSSPYYVNYSSLENYIN